MAPGSDFASWFSDAHVLPDFTIEQVSWSDARAIALRAVMDADMATRYPHFDEEVAVTQERTAALSVDPDEIVTVLLALDPDGTPIGHVALRPLRDEWEAKRLIVAPSARGRGVATALLAGIVASAREHGASRLILQTGWNQPESVALYRKLGFEEIPVYEPYAATMPKSLCFALPL